MNLDALSVKTAVASFGMSSEVFHCPTLHYHRHFEIRTILERNSNKACNRYPYVQIVRTYDQLLSDPEIELVIVNTPNELHFPMAEAALLAGKHVVVEKPFTVHSDEAAELIRLAKKQNKILSVFHSKRFETDFLALKQVIDSDLIGKPTELHWHYDRYRPGITHKLWKEKNFPGAGVLYDLGVHLIDSTVQLLGKPATVTCHMRVLRRDAGAADYFHIRLGYPQTDVYLHSSTLVMEKGPHIQLHGTRGSYIRFSSDPQEEQLKSGMSPLHSEYGKDNPGQLGFITIGINGKTVEEKLESKKGNYGLFYDGIFNAIRYKAPLNVEPEQALQNIRIIECATQSNREQRTINYEC